MPKCKIEGCDKFTRSEVTKESYCPMHKERIKRHGYPEPKKDAYQCMERLPHPIVDDFIKDNCQKLIDAEIAEKLREMGFPMANSDLVKYRRRKLGVKKYLYGEVQKHKAWVRAQAIKKYGTQCELCGYTEAVDTHHIIPKFEGGQHTIDNLIVICPNCHALITRKHLALENRKDIPRVRSKVSRLIKTLYKDFL